MKCELCNNDFLNLGCHIVNGHKHSSIKEYYDIYLKKENEGICYCGKETQFLGSINKGYSKCCSCSCAQNHPNTKKKQRKAKLGKIRLCFKGDNNPAKRPDVRKKISKVKKENWSNPKGVYNTKEYRKKLSKEISKALKGKSYEERHGKEKAEILKEKRRQHCLNGHALTMLKKIQSPSKPQIELFKIVKKIFPNAELNYPMLNYLLDIAIPDKKIDIEYDCSYWHSEEKDNRRNEKLHFIGWKVIRFIDRLPSINEIREIA